jgi:hypothetical protein
MFMTCLLDIIVDPYWIYSLLVLRQPVLGLFTSDFCCFWSFYLVWITPVFLDPSSLLAYIRLSVNDRLILLNLCIECFYWMWHSGHLVHRLILLNLCTECFYWMWHSGHLVHVLMCFWYGSCIYTVPRGGGGGAVFLQQCCLNCLLTGALCVYIYIVCGLLVWVGVGCLVGGGGLIMCVFWLKHQIWGYACP